MAVVQQLYLEAVQGFERRLASAGTDQWDAPTPCSEWSVRDLVSHVLAEQLWVPPLVGGESIADVGDRFEGDQLGSDPVAAWRAATDAVAAVIAEPGALDRIVGLSYGEVPTADYLLEVAGDTVVHTWDLARATGGDEQLDPAHVTQAMAFISPRLDAYRGAGVVGPQVDVPDDADDQTKLLAALGRRA